MPRHQHKAAHSKEETKVTETASSDTKASKPSASKGGDVAFIDHDGKKAVNFNHNLELLHYEALLRFKELAVIVKYPADGLSLIHI